MSTVCRSGGWHRRTGRVGVGGSAGGSASRVGRSTRLTRARDRIGVLGGRCVSGDGLIGTRPCHASVGREWEEQNWWISW